MNSKFNLPREDKEKYPRIEAARNLAIEAHGSQCYGEYPYVYHLDQVAYYVKEYGEAAIIIAYLHDILEDTHTPEEVILQAFGKVVLDCVKLLTDPVGETRQQRKNALNEKLAQADESLHLALIVKVADRLANVRESIKSYHHKMWKRYELEYPEFRAATYRPDLCERLWRILDVYMEKDAYEHFRGER